MGRAGPARPPTLHVYLHGSLDPHAAPHIYREGPGHAARPPNPSLYRPDPADPSPCSQPFSFGQTPHFYQPQLAQIHGWPKSRIVHCLSVTALAKACQVQDRAQVAAATRCGKCCGSWQPGGVSS